MEIYSRQDAKFPKYNSFSLGVLCVFARKSSFVSFVPHFVVTSLILLSFGLLVAQPGPTLGRFVVNGSITS